MEKVEKERVVKKEKEKAKIVKKAKEKESMAKVEDSEKDVEKEKEEAVAKDEENMEAKASGRLERLRRFERKRKRLNLLHMRKPGHFAADCWQKPSKVEKDK